MMTKTNTQIIKMMQENPVVIDNHTDKEEQITGLVEFKNPEMNLACCFDSMYYSLNSCYIGRDGKLHCSQSSIGGVLWGANPNSEQLKNYNNSCFFEYQKIQCIHKPDGTMIFPAA